MFLLTKIAFLVEDISELLDSLFTGGILRITAFPNLEIQSLYVFQRVLCIPHNIDSHKL
jgi:hypothetical protein